MRLDRVGSRELEELLGQAVRSFEARPSAYRTSSPIDEIDAVLDDGTRLELLLKDCDPGSWSPAAQEAKPAFLREPSREIRVYTELLGRDGTWAPRVFGATLDPERGRWWLLLERVKGVELFQVGAIDTWCAVARWLARLHRDLTPAADAAKIPLLRYDGELYRRWSERALSFGRPGPRLRTVLDGPLAERLAALPNRFIHGEAYASNLLVVVHGEHVRVTGVDWELAALGPALVDLAALSSGNWSSELRTQIVQAYWEEWKPADPAADANRFQETLTLARLHLAVQWLGWSATWTPPTHLSHDWRGEAEDLVGELGW